MGIGFYGLGTWLCNCWSLVGNMVFVLVFRGLEILQEILGYSVNSGVSCFAFWSKKISFQRNGIRMY